MAHMTKTLLAESLKKLLRQKTLDKITVKEIAEDCGVNRQTFYYNFQDIYDLMDWIFEEETREFLGDRRAYVSWQEGFTAVFDHLRENEHLVLNAFNSVSRVSLERFLKNRFSPIMQEIVKEESNGIQIDEKDEAFIVDLYVLILSGIVIRWLESDMSGDYQQQLDQLKTAGEGSVEFLMNKFSK